MMRLRMWGVLCALTVTVSCSECSDSDPQAVPDAGTDAGADVDVDVQPDVSLSVEVPYEVEDYPIVEGFGEGGPRQAEDGCLVWDPDTAPRTMKEGMTLEDEDGNPVEAGEGEVLPLVMCNEHTVEVEVYDRNTPTPELPPLAHPPCTPDDNSGCPEVGTQPVLPPAYRPDAPVPPTPRRYTAPTSLVANMMATPGTGESFESGTLANWTVGGTFPTSPVFGNNISIKRLLPPGFPVRVVTDPDGSRRVEYPVEENIGGDYWEFSASANQQGNFWVGTVDDRSSHLQRPGTTRSELLTGTLTSPRITLAADYLSFWIGGTEDEAQRFELHVLANDPNDAGALAATYQGIGTVEFPENWDQMNIVHNENDGSLWIVVRAGTAAGDHDYMGRNVVWDISEYGGRTARLRIVDAARSPAQEERCVGNVCQTVDRVAHINIDGIEFIENTPPGLRNLLDAGGPSPVSEFVREQPLWGFTESHSHATANLSFGGHMIWGDWGDELSDVYDCLHDLPEIADNAGRVLRPAISDPRRAVTCTVRPEIVATMVSVTTGVCIAASVVLNLIPVFGPAIAAAELAACTALITTAAAALTTPLMTGHYYHGALMPTSGAIEPGPILSTIVGALVGALDRIPGMVEEKDYDSPDGTHSGRGLGQFHNHYQKDMIRRAYDGGLRLMVIDVHNSRAMQAVLDGVSDYDDWRAIREHVSSVERLVAGPGDPNWPVGDLNDIAEIAYTPAQARTLVRQNKLAIILGVEVMELGKNRSGSDTMAQQVRDMYDLGIRKITPIHGTNNPLGGSGLFQDVYQAANVFNNLTIDSEGRDIAVWEDLTEPIRMGLPADFPEPFNEMTLGTWGVMSTMQAPDCSSGCPFEVQNDGFFTLTTDPDPGNVIGGVADVTWRLGFPSISHMQPFDTLDDVDSTYLGINRAYSLGWLLGEGPAGVIPSRECSLEGMFLPLATVPGTAIEDYYDRIAPTGHFNLRTLTQRGTDFLSAMMEHGMVLDTDHFSQATRVTTLDHIRTFAEQAGWPETDYATMGVHTELRGFEFGGPYPELGDGAQDYASHGGHETEISKTPAELARMTQAGGTITISMPGFFPEDAPYAEGLVDNNCDYSSKGYAQKYLKALELMDGRGVTPGFDMNGFAPFLAPRYGNGFACRTGVSRHALMIGSYDPAEVDANVGSDAWRRDNPPLAAWPRDWQTGREECLYNGSLRDGWRDCPGMLNILDQLYEFSGVVYDDYIARPRFNDPWIDLFGDDYYAVVAREAREMRDDGAPREPVDEVVYLGGGGEFRQERPIVKWKNNGVAVNAGFNTGWDYNLDGLKHIGLMPDMIQDLRNIGVTWELLEPMMRSSEDFISMWERNCEMAQDWAANNGGDPDAVCAPR